MKNITTKTILYSSNDTVFQTLAVTSKIRNVKEILFACNCIPHGFNGSFKKLKTHNVWIDPFKTRLTFSRNGVKVEPCVIDVPARFADQFYGMKLVDILKISNKTYVCIGQEPDFETPHVVIGSVGIDKVIRCYTFIYDQWIQISPFFFGMRFVNFLYNSKVEENFLVLEDCDKVKYYNYGSSATEELRRRFKVYNLDFSTLNVYLEHLSNQ